MAGNFKPAPREKNAFDNKKLNLTAPCPTAKGKMSSLVWGLFSNNPRITVYTNDPEDNTASKNYGKISANLDGPTFFAFLDLLYKVVDHEGEYKDKVDNMNYIFPGGKRSDRPVITSELWVGKDKEGVIWMSVAAPASQDRPRIKFIFQSSEFHHWIHGDGTPYSAAEASKLYARGYVRMLENMMAQMMVSNYVEPPPRDNTRGGNAGGGNRGPSGSGGGSDFGSSEDDIPF
jgi:hypothetical protein